MGILMTMVRLDQLGITAVNMIDPVDGSVVSCIDMKQAQKLLDRLGMPDLDPRPWRYVLLDPNGQAREAEQVTGGFVFDPRPEYEQAREMYP